ncbi:MAG: class I SAM-dependent methyltransferase [Pseudomonadota bacterium]|uniref:class I SAM-dependent methyltransferase n=1 Tax=Roseovarius TaxID=74030 RepID=UPI0022A86C7F|nr:class I SAM-dependent methyltransferase [Roseovarius sp. EGI FJ00037]MCZ0813843.1 class I SAM-dependent methyltransferase [Roseovarius sp. EGI FJ00037]
MENKTTPQRDALGVILEELAPLSGRSVLDIGCGKGRLAARLRAAGAAWRGLDPFAPEGVDAIDRASAEAMPYGDGSFDAAICVNALHHVPVPAMARALSEAARVLRREGRLVVIEPRASGALSRVLAVVDDETEIRNAAQAAMDTTRALREVTAYDYPRVERYSGFQGFCDSLIAVDPGRAALIEANADALRRAFERHATRDDGAWLLSQPMSVRIFQPV